VAIKQSYNFLFIKIDGRLETEKGEKGGPDFWNTVLVYIITARQHSLLCRALYLVY